MGDSVRKELEQLASDGRLRLDLNGAFGTLWLDHPSRRNAFSAQMMLDLEDAVERLEGWDGAVLLVRGVGGHLCAGADLRLMKSVFSSREGGVWMSQWMSGLLNRILDAPFLSFALVEGAAMGGGAELACATDFRIFRRGARLQFVQVARGVSPGWGGAGRLYRLVGRANALRLLGSGQPVDPSWALGAGLIDWMIDEDAAEGSVSEVLDPFLVQSPAAVRINKMAVLAASGEGDGESELDCFASTIEGASLALKTNKLEREA